ncbi:MAG TPA: CoA-binding protein [Candidatus Eremiobacteraceae bacterium]|nr:CoA-binding protein [Candidatus Eremiobacteraceae bacterium]
MQLHLPDNVSKAPDAVRDLLREAKTIAVVGLSSNRFRPSHEVASYLQAAGYKIVPVNPNETAVLGEKAYPRLEDVPVRIDIVDVFRRPTEISPVADSAVAIGAKALWLQQGITNAVAAERARAGGLIVVEDACLLIEHKKWKQSGLGT